MPAVLNGWVRSYIVVPPMLTIRASTFKLLKQFADQGGTVLVSQAYPLFVDGVENAAERLGHS